MRKFTVFFFLLAATGLLCLNTTCKKKVKISYDGTVYDSAQAAVKKPVSNVTVHLSYCDGKVSSGGNGCHGSLHEVASATTDASGHFSIHQTVRTKYDALYITLSGSQKYGDGQGYAQQDFPSQLFVH